MICATCDKEIDLNTAKTKFVQIKMFETIYGEYSIFPFEHSSMIICQECANNDLNLEE